MKIVDWDKWMKDHGLYIPSQEEADEARRLGLKKVKPSKKNDPVRKR